MLYQKRFFTTGPYEAASVYVRRALVNGKPYVILKDDPECAFRGALRAHFEQFATLYYVELLMRGHARLCSRLTFVFEKPAWTNGRVSFDAEWREVSMKFGATGYRLGQWRALTSAEISSLNEQPSVGQFSDA